MRKLKNKKGYSLIEILISLVILSILMLILMYSILINMNLSMLVSARAKIRTELDNISAQVERDIRNSDAVDKNNCDGKIYCVFEQNSKKYLWTKGSANTTELYMGSEDYNCKFKPSTDWEYSYICKYDISNPSYPLIKSERILEIESVQFYLNTNEGEVQPGSYIYANVVFTMVASARTDSWGVSNQVRQLTITTKNYQIYPF